MPLISDHAKFAEAAGGKGYVVRDVSRLDMDHAKFAEAAGGKGYVVRDVVLTTSLKRQWLKMFQQSLTFMLILMLHHYQVKL